MISTRCLRTELKRLQGRRKTAKLLGEQISIDGSVLTIRKLIHISIVNDRRKR
jgi:hypothetical protein